MNAIFPVRAFATALALVLLAAAPAAFADSPAPGQDQSAPKYLGLSGPRVGVSFLQGRSYAALKDRVGEGSYPFVTVIGWQFEHAWLSGSDGTAGLIEIVPTLSGFNHGLFIPGLNALIGLRSGGGLEGGIGGQLSIVGGREIVSAGALFAIGATVRGEALNFPIHLVWVTSPNSQRVAIMFGFSAAQK